jgi:hypothetical protein
MKERESVCVVTMSADQNGGNSTVNGGKVRVKKVASSEICAIERYEITIEAEGIALIGDEVYISGKHR